MKTGKKQPGDSELVTHMVRPDPKLVETLSAALEQERSVEGLTKAQEIVGAAVDQWKSDPRVQRLATLLPQFDPSEVRLEASHVKAAFANLASGVKRLQLAAQGTERVSHQEGAEPSAFDRRIMKGVIRLSIESFRELNTPAATVLTVGEKVVAVGMNRSYFPEPAWDRHGEMEALRALRQKTYTGMAQILILHSRRGGALPEGTAASLARLESQGIMEDQSLRLDPNELARGGYFSEAQIARYAKSLGNFLEEGGFMRDAEGRIHPHHRKVHETATTLGVFEADEVAGWEILDRLHKKDPDLKLTVYTSLEPCLMCMSNCTAHGQVGRVVYGARDEDGGATRSIEAFPALYHSLRRVPFEVMGGIEGARAQERYDGFFKNVYPFVKKGEAPPKDLTDTLMKEFGSA